MTSKLLPHIYALLRDEFLLEKDEVVVSLKEYTMTLKIPPHEGKPTISVSVRFAEERICRWYERKSLGKTYFGSGGFFEVPSVAKGVDFVRSQCADNIAVRESLVQKHKKFFEEKEELLAKIKRLKQKNREFKYVPGNAGALKAQQHFESLTE
ncbi:hypothetical protein A9K97_gp084 [Tokyovirus A1]|uniref:hypothetical protein n=1 Tax=Tokyovirus A1 TaxID=1826170 RepID=UPI0007A98748|nr:hypothetical protein A9K97_gp084 [Tokyovirus A1]BAU80267.1 hypothetical protein [Tokyovirus A1]